MSQCQPLTKSQHAMWILHTISGRGELFNVAECVEFSGQISLNYLQQALAHVWQASDTLSCRFAHDNDFQPYLLYDATPPNIATYSIDNEPEDCASFFCKWIQAKLNQPLNIAIEPLMQLSLVRGPHKDYLLILAHHILLDGFAFGIFKQALNRSYNALSKGKSLPKLHFLGQTALLAHEASTQFNANYLHAKNMLNQWLDEVPVPHSFCDNKADVAKLNARQQQVFSKSSWYTMLSIADHLNVGTSEVILAAIAACLVAKHGNFQPVLGLIMMNRQGLAQLSTPCVQSNVLPLPLNFDTDTSLAQAVNQIKQRIKTLKSLQSYRLEDLKRDRQQQGKSLQVIGPTINILPFASHPKFAGILSHSHILSAGTSDDIMLQIHLSGEQPVRIDFDSNQACYSHTDVNQLSNQLFLACKIWSQNPMLSLKQLCLILNNEINHD